MSGKIPWLRVVVEGAVIVGSILLAFAIDTAWEGRQERRSEQEYITRIIADLEETRDQVLENAVHYESLLDHGTAILPILTGAAAVPADTLGFLASVLQASRITDPVVARGAYDDLISTGNLRLVRSELLRAALSRFYANVENQLNPVDFSRDQAAYRETVRSILPADLQMAIRRWCLDADPLTCGEDASPYRIGAVTRAVLAEPGLDRKLNFSMQAMSIRLGFVLDREGFSGGFGVVVEGIDELLALLGASAITS
jgi:hypothetical protein